MSRFFGVLPLCRLMILFCLLATTLTTKANNTTDNTTDNRRVSSAERRIILQFSYAPFLSEDTSKILVELANQLSNYKSKESEYVLVGRLSMEIGFLELSNINEFMPFLEAIALSLQEVATISVTATLQEIVNYLEMKALLVEDENQKTLLGGLIEKLRVAVTRSESRPEYDSTTDTEIDKDKDPKVVGSGVDSGKKNPYFKTEEAELAEKEKRLNEIRAQRREALKRRQDQPGYDLVADDIGRRHRKPDYKGSIKGTLHLNTKQGGETPESSEDVTGKDPQSSLKENSMVVYKGGRTRSENELLAKILSRLSRNQPNNILAAVDDIRNTISEYFSDGRMTIRKFDKAPDIYGRDAETEQVIDILMRKKGGNPLLLGSYFSGKTAVIEKVADFIIDGQYPQEAPYKKAFDHAHIVRIDGLIIGQYENPGKIIKDYFNSVLQLRDKYDINIITYITNIEALPKPVTNELQRALFQNNSVQIIAESQANDFNMAFKNNERFREAFEPVAINKLNTEQTVELLIRNWLDDIQDIYSVNFGETTQDIRNNLEAIVETSQRVYRNLGPIEASIRLMQDIAIKAVREQGVTTTVDEELIYKVVQTHLGFPVNPLDGPAMENYITEIKMKASQKIRGQNKLLDLALEAWAQLLGDKERSIRVGVFMGASGAGKSDLANVLGRIIFDNPERVFTIDGPAVEKDTSLWTYFGATNGYASSDKTPGRLMEWLEDPAGGKFGGILIIDEAERAHPKFWERLMEFFDRGRIIGGDGQVRYANNILVIMTSNKGNNVLVPRGIEFWEKDKLKNHEDSFDENQLKDIFSKKTPGSKEEPIHPAVINRIDFIGLAKLIDKDLVLEIADVKADDWIALNLHDRKVNFVISKELKDHLVLTKYRIQDGFRSPVSNFVVRTDQSISGASRF
ncbi:MAG: ATP-dependent Clp protease ATP-binding subunit [Bdellovibrionaceae bacterium]|nr:ATP-dependent Clp protease ATP-binding subunit [Pseudobdellovibrionaceae bacterium]